MDDLLERLEFEKQKLFNKALAYEELMNKIKEIDKLEFKKPESPFNIKAEPPNQTGFQELQLPANSISLREARSKEYMTNSEVPLKESIILNACKTIGGKNFTAPMLSAYLTTSFKMTAADKKAFGCKVSSLMISLSKRNILKAVGKTGNKIKYEVVEPLPHH